MYLESKYVSLVYTLSCKNIKGYNISYKTNSREFFYILFSLASPLYIQYTLILDKEEIRHFNIHNDISDSISV